MLARLRQTHAGWGRTTQAWAPVFHLDPVYAPPGVVLGITLGAGQRACATRAVGLQGGSVSHASHRPARGVHTNFELREAHGRRGEGGSGSVNLGLSPGCAFSCPLVAASPHLLRVDVIDSGNEALGESRGIGQQRAVLQAPCARPAVGDDERIIAVGRQPSLHKRIGRLADLSQGEAQEAV